MFLSPLSQAPPTLHPRPAHTPSQGGTLALRPFPDAIRRDRCARSSDATPPHARRLSQVLGHSSPPDWIGHKATIECFIVTAPLTKVPPRLPPAPRRNNRRNGKGQEAGPRRRRRRLRAARRRTQGCAPFPRADAPPDKKDDDSRNHRRTPTLQGPSRSRPRTPSPPTKLTRRPSPACLSTQHRRGAEAQGRAQLRQGCLGVPAVHRARRRVQPGRGGSLRREIPVPPRAPTLGRRRRRRHPRAQDRPEERRRPRLARPGVPGHGAGEEGQG